MGLLCFNWARRPLIALDAPVGDVVNELHDFWDIFVQFLAALDGEIDKVKIRGHSAEKPCVPNKAVNLLHIVNSLRAGFNANTAVSSNQIPCHGCFHALSLVMQIWGCVPFRETKSRNHMVLLIRHLYILTRGKTSSKGVRGL